MSIGGRITYSTKPKSQKTKKFEVKGKLDPAQWAEFFEKLNALMKHYHIKITRIRDA